MTIKVLGISGSLRERSYNSALLRSAVELLPEGMSLEIAGIGDLPLYNQDIRPEDWPEPVLSFRAKISAADALLIATPEYNFSMPGVLKNSIDWASRLPDPPLDCKPLAMMGASTGLTGTARAQLHLRHVCVFTNMLPINKPEVLVAHADRKFDADLNLVDETARALLAELLSNLKDWVVMTRPGDRLSPRNPRR